MKKFITFSSAQDLVSRYIAAGGVATIVAEGCLGLGTIVLQNNGLNLKEFVIQEENLNEWSSCHILKTYLHGLPKKYIKAAAEVMDAMHW